jgi:hypothetical protein
MCETNAYLAYCNTVKQISRHDFREQLAWELCNYDQLHIDDINPNDARLQH